MKIVLFFLLLIGTVFQGFSSENSSQTEIDKLKKEIRVLNQVIVKLIAVIEKTGNDEVKKELALLQQEVKKLNSEYEEESRTYPRRDAPLNHLVEQKTPEQLELKQDSDLESLMTDLEISGFFDVSIANKRVNPNIFELGDFELDLEKSLAENFQVGAAMVFNDDGAELAVGFIDYHFYGGKVRARGRPLVEDGLHIQLGRFDVPFGNDWQYFASVDRISVTAPLTTELVMDGGYNDTGVRILGNRKSHNYSFHVLKGIEEGLSIGGRLGFTPFNNPYSLKEREEMPFEIGISYLYDMDSDNHREEYVWGLDAQINMGWFGLRSEYTEHVRNVFTLETGKGYHFTVQFQEENWFDFPVTFFARYGSVTLSSFDFEQDISRFSVGLNMNIKDTSFIKFEYNNYLKEAGEFYGNTLYGQMVITF